MDLPYYTRVSACRRYYVLSREYVDRHKGDTCSRECVDHHERDTCSRSRECVDRHEPIRVLTNVLTVTNATRAVEILVKVL